MPYPDYTVTDTANGVVDHSTLQQELRALDVGASVYGGLTVCGDDITVHFDPEPDASGKATVDAAIAAHAPDLLAPLKVAKCEEIDAKTDAIIDKGFDYGGVTISLSPAYQTNITNVYLARNEPWVPYPITWNSIDDLSSVDTVDAAAVEAMYQAAMAAVRGARDSGTALKATVRAATTVAEVEAVEDNR